MLLLHATLNTLACIVMCHLMLIMSSYHSYYVTYCIVCTIVYRLTAAATITFSKRKGPATKRGQLLYKGGH